MGESAGLFINVLTFYFCFRPQIIFFLRKADRGITPLSFALPSMAIHTEPEQLQISVTAEDV